MCRVLSIGVRVRSRRRLSRSTLGSNKMAEHLIATGRQRRLAVIIDEVV
jgi:hypothetical protein